MKKIYATLGLGFITATGVFSQDTYTEVYTILQANCVTGCHGGANPSGKLALSGNQADVYNNLINVTPTNPAAKNNGFKQIMPGYPARSYLFRKINNNLYSHIKLEVAEGEEMPSNQPPLSKTDIDLINSWILFGAPETGTVVDKKAINDYYNGKGIVALGKPNAPDPSEGMQIHVGSIFLNPQEEKEYFLKHDIYFPDSVEVSRIESFINGYSHHYIIYKFNDASEASQKKEGLREVSIFSGDAFGPGKSVVAVWQDPGNFILPEGTGYFWGKTAHLDLNYHIRNYSTDSILKAELYSNVYFKPKQNSTVEMHSDLVLHPNNQVDLFKFSIPNDSQDHTYEGEMYFSGSSATMYLWQLSTHTHKYGQDYDVFLRNSDGSHGDKIYDGYFNYEVDPPTDMGFYDFGHPPIKYFSPLLEVPLKDGLIHEATYNNSGSKPAKWGLTTDDEMMLITIQYTLQKPSVGILNKSIAESTINVFPNPVSNSATIQYSLDKQSTVAVELVDLLGKQVAKVLGNTIQNQGSQSLLIDLTGISNPGTILFLKIAVDDTSYVKKLIVKSN